MVEGSSWRNLRPAFHPTLLALALFTAVAMAAGAMDDYRFCRLIHIGYFLDPSLLTPCDRATSAAGYDGQFYFALAHDPFLTRPETAMALDDTLRYRRILYPLVAWVLSAGQAGALPYVMVIINVVAATALIWIAAVAAIAARRSVWWALALAVFGGVWLPIFYDLTEPLQLALLAVGMTSGSAAFVLLAGLAKETAGVALVVELARGLVQGDRQRVLRFGLAAAALAAWALIVWLFVRGAGESTLGGQLFRPVGAPVIALSEAVQDDGRRFVLILVGFVVCLLAIARVSRARDGAALAGALYAAVVLGAGYDSWRDPLAVYRAMAGAVVLVYLSWLHARDLLGKAAIVLAAASGIAYPILTLNSVVR